MENRVLIVEAEAPLRRSLEKFLGQAGYAFDSCSSGREALALAEKWHYDVIIAEYRLPDANGSSLLQKMKRIIPEAAMILISEYDYQAVAKDIAQADVHSFLQKPFDLVEIENALLTARLRPKARVKFRKVVWKPELCLEGIPASIFK